MSTLGEMLHAGIAGSPTRKRTESICYSVYRITTCFRTESTMAAAAAAAATAALGLGGDKGDEEDVGSVENPGDPDDPAGW
jgi:hypothetical protein